MYTQEQILDRVRTALVDVFEIDAQAIGMNARLADDLDIDSIDAVDLIAELRDMLPRKFEPEEFNSVATIGDVVRVLANLVGK